MKNFHSKLTDHIASPFIVSQQQISLSLKCSLFGEVVEMDRKSWMFVGAIITVVVAGYGSGQSWHMLEPPLGEKYDEGWL